MALNTVTITSHRIAESLRSIMESGDPKTADWPLVATPWPTVAFVAAYLFIVKVGPKIMETRKAYSLREVLIVYNFSLVLLSAWMTYESIASAMDIPNFNFVCQSIPYIRGDEKRNRLARVIYVYWLSKFVEALETIFFILRKKNTQVSFLHVYHHTTMFFIGWAGAKWLPGGVTFFGTAMNSFVHTVMYAYYGLSSIGPHMRPYLWWKHYITKLQLMQFAVLLMYTVNALRINCFTGAQQTFPIYVILVFEVTLVVLFSNFYIQAYLSKNEAISNTENYNQKID